MKKSTRKLNSAGGLESQEDSTRIVVIGASRGGTDALRELISTLPADYPFPIIIAQHRQDRSSGLSSVLQNCCSIPVVEPDDKDPLETGHVYIAPAGYHLLIEDHAFALSLDDAPNAGRPSIDLLFETAAECYKHNTIGIILTGGSRDGSLGLARLKQLGGYTIVQHPDSAASSLMPRSAIAASSVDQILDLQGIASFLRDTVNHESRIGG